jgi:NADP-dependent 3-hydroxy acid dehydrogenase YdfG
MASKRVAALIGYGPGIGHSVASKWAAEGYAVALVSRTASKLEAAVKAIPNAHAFPCDVMDTAALTACMGSIESSLGEIDALLYNCGNGMWKQYDEITVEQLQSAMQTNVYGLLTCGSQT